MGNICQRCKESTEDIRFLAMACGYDMNELPIPFNDDPIGFTLNVCKDCRAQWMESIVEWFKNPKKYETCGSGIYVRRYGANVEITEEEFRKKNPYVEPVRVLEDVEDKD